MRDTNDENIVEWLKKRATRPPTEDERREIREIIREKGPYDVRTYEEDKSRK